MNNLKELFLLDPSIIFLNHGSFGSTPRPVFEAYQGWQRRLERQPVLFLSREFTTLDRQARQALGAYLHVDPDDLAFVTNATHGVNILARALKLGPGDEILTSDHEYGACDYIWEFNCAKTGAAYIRQPISFPALSPVEIVEEFWHGVTPRTRLVFLSHITSGTALRLPVEMICQRAQAAGILTLIDGAHAPGQIPLNLEAVGADFYTGNCHKWMMAPKGAGFLYVRHERQELVEPLVVSWGYHSGEEFRTGSRFIDYLSWTGTRDPAAALAVPAAIQFQQDYKWETVRQECHALLCQALQRVNELTGLEPMYPEDAAYPDGNGFFRQMAVALLPDSVDLPQLKAQLYDEFRIEIPCTEWNGKKFLRISIQGYNTPDDVDALITALRKLI